MRAEVVIIWMSLIAVGVAAVHHFGWEGIAIPALAYILMPWQPNR